jgi:quinol monooxygenase YgiN
MSSRLYCIAEFAPKAGKEQELLEALTSLEPLALREDGCIRYRVTRQIQYPGSDTPSPFSIMFNEEWSSKETFDAHANQAYVVEFFAKYIENPETSLVADSSLRIFSDEI